MKQPLNEQFRRMQKLAGIITESQFTEAESITITKIEKGKDTGMEFGAIGAGYTITLSNGKTVESNDDDLLDRYEVIRDGRKDIDQLNKILVGKSWDIDENQIQENLNFDYQERKSGDVIVMDDKTMDDILDDLELQDYINPKSFTRNNKGEIVLGVDHMDYEQFDKLAKFLGIKY